MSDFPKTETNKMVAATLAAAIIGVKGKPIDAESAVQIFNEVVAELADNAIPPMTTLRGKLDRGSSW